MRIASVVGARPNFIKLAPIHKALAKFADHIIIHTGQHYDYELSEIFFKEFHLPEPRYELGIGSGRSAFQIGEMVKRLDEVFLERSDIDIVLVYGDTNSTFAGALAAKTSGIRVGHIESGLRSRDSSMPEEINRILTDHISDYLFAPTPTAIKNLETEHVLGKIIYSGDVSVEIVNNAIDLLSASKNHILDDLHLQSKSYVLFTMHRAENTNSEKGLTSIIRAFEILSEMEYAGQIKKLYTTSIVFPIHPRTSTLLKNKKLHDRIANCRNLKLIEPVGYIDFIRLMQKAKKIVTDSGGVQKEAYLLGIPCITIRNSTEWVETVSNGWNLLTGTDTGKVVEAVRNWTPETTNNRKPIFGDGNTSTVIRDFLIHLGRE